MPLHGEARGIESGFVQADDVLAELAPVHLIILANFTAEVRGRLGNFRKRLDFEGAVAGYFAAVEIANPSAGENPGIFGRLPGGAGGEDAAPHLESDRVEFKDAEAAEEIAVGVEQFVVIDLAVLAENPLMRRLKISLRRTAFNLVAQRVLLLIGVGQIGVVEQEHTGGDDAPGQDEWQNQPIHADAAGFESDHFVIFGHDREGHEGSDQSGQRRELVNHERNQFAEIIEHHARRNVVFRNIAKEIKKGEGVEDQDEAGQQNEKIIKKTLEQIDVDEHGEGDSVAFGNDGALIGN